MSKWMDKLEKFQVVIYRRPNFLSWDFEMESYIGQGILRNLFHAKITDEKTKKIILSFPERWLNCVECALLFERLEMYYPKLKELKIKTHTPLIIMNVPNKYAIILKAEDDITESSGKERDDDYQGPTSLEDVDAVFRGFSDGKICQL